jgi:hypothetical protein
MKNITVLFILFCSCNSAIKKEGTTTELQQQQVVVAEDSMLTKLKGVVLIIEKQELSSVNFLKQIMVDSVQYKTISLKEYYEGQKAGLEKIAHLSTNKEKTHRAIVYLNEMIAGAASDKKIYEVVFHLNALLSNNIVYNEHHVKYLHDDLSEIRLVFP